MINLKLPKIFILLLCMALTCTNCTQEPEYGQIRLANGMNLLYRDEMTLRHTFNTLEKTSFCISGDGNRVCEDYCTTNLPL